MNGASACRGGGSGSREGDRTKPGRAGGIRQRCGGGEELPHPRDSVPG